MEKVLSRGQELEKEKLMTHIKVCSTCRQKFEALQQVQKMCEEALTSEELPITFTNEVMQSIEQRLAIESNSTNIKFTELDNPKPSSIRLKKMRSSLFKMKVVSALLAVIVMLLAISIFVQPSLAEKIRSMFTKTEQDTFDVVDPGLRSAFNQGLVTTSDIVAKNGDYTLELKDVYVDPLRVSMSVLLKDKNGNEIKNRYLKPLSLKVRDRNFREIPSTLYDMGHQRGADSLAYYEATFLEPVLVDELIVNLVLDDSYTLENSKKTEDDYISGKWEFNFSVDLKKTKPQSLFIPVDKQLTTPAGLQVNIDGFVYSPSGTGVGFKTSLTKEAKLRSPGELAPIQSIYYHYEINGEPWNGYSRGISARKDVYNDAFYNVWNKSTDWFSMEVELNGANRKGDIKFVLDGYSIAEKSDEKITFKPTEISESQPIVFDSLGDKFNITGMEYRNRGNSDEKEMQITISKGSFINFMSGDQWELVDEKGQTYPVYFDITGGESSAMYGYPQLFDSGYIYVHNLTEVPKQVTLKRTIVERFYKDINWSFIIPKEGFVPQRDLIERDRFDKK